MDEVDALFGKITYIVLLDEWLQLFLNMIDIAEEIGDYGVKYQDEFVEMFNERVIQPVLEKPEMVRKIFWERIK